MHQTEVIGSLKAEVFDRQKTLAEIYKNYGHVSLFDYANEWQVGEFRLADVFAKALEAQVKKLYPDMAQKIVSQLQTWPLVSTIDHLGILNHPFFINSNLIFSLRQHQKFLICLPTAGVSLNNSSYPGCLMRHDEQGNIRRISFFPDRLKNLPVFSALPINKASLDKINLAKDLQVLLFNDELIFNFAHFSEQACALSSRFWQLIFPAAPKLIYLPLEDLVSRVIVEIVAPQSDHLLHQLFFTQAGWQLLEKYFRGLKGAFDIPPRGSGSFLFWGIDARGNRLRLFREGLRIKDKRFFDLELKPDAISAVLNNKQIYPTSLICFLILLYYRITCLGGFNQVNWLSEIKEKFIQLLKELGETGEAERIAKIPTDNFAEGNLSFLYQNGKLIKPAGWDIFSLGDKQIYEKYQNLGKTITVAESIETLLPEIYKIITPQKERRPLFTALSDETIAESLGLPQKIRSVLTQ